MKKIMFNDKYGLTQAVLDGRKTITRRLIPQNVIDAYYEYEDAYCSINFGGVSAYSMTDFLCGYSRYYLGDVLAIAQSYETLANNGYLDKMMDGALSMKKEYAGAGYKNKMFVKAELMPHHIKITSIRVERLQDISDDDCLREGIYLSQEEFGKPSTYTFNDEYLYMNPRSAFKALIDKVSGKGTWKSNPMVWVYEFELVD